MATNNDLIYTPIEDWQLATLATGWTNVGSSFATAAYYKDPFGIVHLRGLVNGGSGTIFTLPTGYRPTGFRLIFPAVASNAIARIDIALNGAVTFVAGTATSISLDGITFR